MKALVFCTCILMCAYFILTENPNTANIGYDTLNKIIYTCITENNATSDDVFSIIQIVRTNVYNQPEMQERRKKNGCIFTCFLKQLHSMEGTDFKEEAMRNLLTRFKPGGEEVHVNQALHDCIQETKNVTPVCEKSFVMAVCFLQTLYRLEEAK